MAIYPIFLFFYYSKYSLSIGSDFNIDMHTFRLDFIRSLSIDMTNLLSLLVLSTERSADQLDFFVTFIIVLVLFYFNINFVTAIIYYLFLINKKNASEAHPIWVFIVLFFIASLGFSIYVYSVYFIYPAVLDFSGFNTTENTLSVIAICLFLTCVSFRLNFLYLKIQNKKIATDNLSNPQPQKSVTFHLSQYSQHSQPSHPSQSSQKSTSNEHLKPALRKDGHPKKTSNSVVFKSLLNQ
jgi:hypothetical protein